MIRRIEIDFAIRVEITDDQQRRFAQLVQEIAKANEKPGRAHWLFGSGSKPTGNFITDDAMTFDDEILYFETFERAENRRKSP